ncbi:MAG TPA: septum formation initiator family protein [Chloroflexota bacterium]|jgi:cell division protein FtsL|nr:septum formation initiator family protein [Chloroflexota bacterium]
MPPFPFEEAIVRKRFGPPPMSLRLIAVLTVPLLLYALVATGQKALDNYRLNQQADALRVEVRDLRAENIDLQQQILRARTDSAIEAIARQELGLIRPGDNPVVLVPTSPAPRAEAPAAPPSAPPSPPWRQWWDRFFG